MPHLVAGWLLQDSVPCAQSLVGGAEDCAGVPFGSQAAEEAFLREELAKQRKFLERLRRFPDPQVALTLLRVCLGVQKVTHLLRAMWGPIRLPSRSVTRFQNLVGTSGGNTYTYEEIRPGLVQAGFGRIRLLQKGEHMDGLVEGFKP